MDEEDEERSPTVLSNVTQCILVETQEDSKAHGYMTYHKLQEVPLQDKMFSTGGCNIGACYVTLEYAVLS